MSPRASILKIAEAMNTAIIGQETVVERLLIAFLADGHVLMEGLLGVAKTRSIKTLGKLVNVIELHNTCYELEQWRFPTGEYVTASVPVPVRGGH